MKVINYEQEPQLATKLVINFSKVRKCSKNLVLIEVDRLMGHTKCKSMYPSRVGKDYCSLIRCLIPKEVDLDNLFKISKYNKNKGFTMETAFSPFTEYQSGKELYLSCDDIIIASDYGHSLDYKIKFNSSDDALAFFNQHFPGVTTYKFISD